MANKKMSGFTIIEIIFVVAILEFAGLLFFMQSRNIAIASRDNSKKTAINSIYYSLEEVFYTKNGYYPQQVNNEILPTIETSTFIDANGKQINTAGSDYSYTPLNCNSGHCKSYELKANLENEADYIKTSKNN